MPRQSPARPGPAPPHLALHGELGEFLRALEVHHNVVPLAEGEREPQFLLPGRGGPVGEIALAFGLSDFERAVLGLALAQELFPLRFRRAAAGSLGLPADLGHGALTPYLCGFWLGDGDPAAFLDDAPLLRWGLLRAGPGLTGDLSLRSLSVAPGVLAFAQGHGRPDPDLARVAGLLEEAATLSGSQAARLAQVRKHLARDPDTRGVLLYGTDAAALTALAGHALAGGGPALRVDAAAVASSRDGEAALIARAVGRDTRLKGFRLVVDATGDAPEGGTLDAMVEALIDAAQGPVAVLSPAPLPLRTERTLLPLEVTPPTPAEGRERWAEALGVSSEIPALRLLGDQFQLSLDRIDALAREARAALPGNAPHAARVEAAWEAARTANRRLMGPLAQRVAGGATWDSLVLPEADRRVLEQICAHVRHRAHVYETLGMAHAGRGRAITALFSGPSGTGKTLSAEVLANELRLDLYRVDLSSTVSKYIGETEKNLKRIFDAADAGGCILLFDEADSVFGKRAEVKDANDRYANVQVNYLLQRLETFNGLSILTTNLESSMDVAFMRRIQYVLNFRAPGPPERERLWRGAFPPALDVSGVDFPRLAQAEVSGGNIRSVAMNAVFMSVARGEPLGDALLQEALLLEYRKLGRLVLDEGWMAPPARF